MTERKHENATRIDYKDAPNTKRQDGSETKRSQFRRLSVANGSVHNGKWKDRNQLTQKDGEAIFSAIVGKLELTPYQREETHRVFRQAEPELSREYRTALLVFAIAGHIGRRDGRDYHPQKLHPKAEHSHYKFVANELDVTHSRLASCWHAVEEYI
jgi:hypothetical protein